MSEVIDEATLKEIEKAEKQNKSPKKKAAVKHTAPDVKEESVWVKCVSKLKPHVTGDDGQPFPLAYWEDYKIPTEEATLLHDREMVVILKAKEEAA